MKKDGRRLVGGYKSSEANSQHTYDSSDHSSLAREIPTHQGKYQLNCTFAPHRCSIYKKSNTICAPVVIKLIPRVFSATQKQAQTKGKGRKANK